MATFAPASHHLNQAVGFGHILATPKMWLFMLKNAFADKLQTKICIQKSQPTDNQLITKYPTDPTGVTDIVKRWLLYDSFGEMESVTP